VDVHLENENVIVAGAGSLNYIWIKCLNHHSISVAMETADVDATLLRCAVPDIYQDPFLMDIPK
jgi:hypothetical protein